jgi:cellulose synthase/poly-beta-1,6-N-acetylglucosamine synthase-like glycosyltransferase
MTSVPLLVFWISLTLLVYLYVGYPIVVWLLGCVRLRRRARVNIEPSVSVVVVAYNEADRIGARLRNLLELDYPHEKIEIIVASDGSTDGTVEACRAAARRSGGAGRAHAEPDVKVHAFPWRRGKAAVLNDVVPKARGEIVVFGDARQNFECGAVRALVASFGDARVGAASGELMIRSARTAAGEGSSFYWRYEKFIRRSESRAGSVVGATGAIYAIRRTLFQSIPEDTVLDDVLIPMRVVKQGYRVVFESLARAYDNAPTRGRQEFVRKARTIAGTFQLFARERWLLNPLRNPLWFQTVSHKGLRLLAPALHAGVLAAAFALREVPFYWWMLAAQAAFYGAAAGGYLTQNLRRRPRVLSVPYAICLMNWATVAGGVRFLQGRQPATWDRAEQPAAPPPHATRPWTKRPSRTPMRS